MKGLLYKDYLNIKKQAKMYLLVIGIWLFVSILEKNPSYFSGLVVVFSGLIPITLYSYDEKVSWDKYALTMPVSKRELVCSRYVFGLMTLVAGLAIAVLASIFSGQAQEEIVMLHCIFAAIGLACIAVTLPIVFKFGTERARIIMFLIILVPVVIALGLKDVGIPVPDQNTIRRLVYLMPAAAAVLLALSVPFSIRIYEKKEF